MNCLLREDTFSSFLLRKALLRCANDIEIDGSVNKAFYEDEASAIPESSYIPWLQVRDNCFDLIKGRHTPLELKFVLLADSSMTAKAIELSENNISPSDCTLTLSARFYEGKVTLTSGTALNSFTLDKSLEKTWDTTIKAFLDAAFIDFEEL
ncbi:DUF5721 family protein [Butyrivibrio sp. MC2013]|uniref:DUF5721 family protein n=1 Tax=Butyrivibrio sp. MC2013 TaxID=1280686 RepID=UPI00040F9DE1|nr:DUF5721 family protein [Butyrivibrio sp. MC2013]